MGRSEPAALAIRGDLGHAEVQDLRLSSLGDEDVRRLDVSVHDPDAMSGLERIRHLNAQIDHTRNRRRPVRDRVRERLPTHSFHHEEGTCVVLADIVHRADVRMIERGRRPRLALEAGACVSAVGEARRQKL